MSKCEKIFHQAVLSIKFARLYILTCIFYNYVLVLQTQFIGIKVKLF